MNVRQNNISCYTFGQMPEDAKLPTIICPFHIWIFGTKGSAQSFGGAHLYWMVTGIHLSMHFNHQFICPSTVYGHLLGVLGD